MSGKGWLCLLSLLVFLVVDGVCGYYSGMVFWLLWVSGGMVDVLVLGVSVFWDVGV